MMSKLAFCAFGAFSFALCAFASSDKAVKVTSKEPLSVVATVPYLADLVGEVTCDSPKFKVETLVPAKLDPHDYQLTPIDRRTIAKAKLVVAVGHGFEHWIDHLELKQQLFKATDKLKLERRDVHIWHSPSLTSDVAASLAETLSKFKPELARRIEECRGTFDAKIKNTILHIHSNLADLPMERRVFAVGHDSIRYFAEFFNFKVVSLSQYRDEAFRTPGELRKMIAALKKQGVKAFFTDATGPTKQVTQLSKESGIKIAGSLYTDGLGPSGSGAESIVGMWTRNADILRAGLKN